jgi:hypothetical protein
MSPAIYETASVKIAAGKYRFSVSASKIKFDGFLSVYKDDDEKSENKALIHGISEESQVSLADVKGEQHFTQPPAHFTEASLVKQLEELFHVSRSVTFTEGFFPCGNKLLDNNNNRHKCAQGYDALADIIQFNGFIRLYNIINHFHRLTIYQI